MVNTGQKMLGFQDLLFFVKYNALWSEPLNILIALFMRSNNVQFLIKIEYHVKKIEKYVQNAKIDDDITS